MTILAFAGYTVLLFALGFVGLRRTRDYADFVLGGRRLGPLVAAISAGASDMSGWLLLALPGLAVTAGAEAGWIAIGLLAGTWLNWRILAPRLRTATIEADDAVTIPEFLAHRFPAYGPILRRIAGIAIVLFFTLYAAAGLVAGAKLFVHVFAWPYLASLWGGAAVILAYTLCGGFVAVALTDLVQGLLMIAALILVPILAAGAADLTLGGQLATWAGGLDAAPAAAIVSSLAWGLGYFGQPHILARFMAIERASAVPTARRIATTWTALGLGGALAVGIVGSAPEFGALAASDAERIFLELIGLTLPALVAGTCLAGVLAAVMSTADSQLLVAASAIASDLFPGGSRSGHGMTRGRLGVLAVVLAAAAIASDPESRIIDLVSGAWAGFGATFGPLLILTLYVQGFSERGALAALTGGFVTVLAWPHLPGGADQVYELLPGFVAGLTAGLAVHGLDARSRPAAAERPGNRGPAGTPDVDKK